MMNKLRMGRPATLALVCVVLVLGPGCAQRTTASAEGSASGSVAGSVAELREPALEQIRASAKSEDPILRANALEAIEAVPGEAAALAEAAVEDVNQVVRFAALMLIGDLKIEELGEAALARREDESYHVRAAAIHAAKATGQDVDASPLSRLVMAPDPGLRSNVAIVLGRMGDASAVPMLREAAAAPLPRAAEVQHALLRIQVAEALVQLGDERARSAIRAAAYSHHDEVRVLALSMMGRLEDRRMMPAMEYMVHDQPMEIRLAAAEGLARLGSGLGLEAMLEGARSRSAPVRAQAAFGLGLIPDAQAARALKRLLEDDSEQVRLSAAAAIVKATAGE